MAQSRLGYMYHRGLGVSTDREQAQNWYQKAAEQEEPRAMNNLALLLDWEIPTSAARHTSICEKLQDNVSLLRRQTSEYFWSGDHVLNSQHTVLLSFSTEMQQKLAR